MSSLFSRLSVVLAALALLTLRAPAGEKQSFYNEVTAVNAEAKTITLFHTPTKSATYKVTGDTRITVDHKPGKFEDLKEGMKVLSVGHKSDSDEADSINAESVKKGKGGWGGKPAPAPKK